MKLLIKNIQIKSFKLIIFIIIIMTTTDAELLYEKAKLDFVNGYKQYLLSDDVSELVTNVVIPNFEPFACDLDELINEIFNNNENSNQTLDYIELIFNTKLYDSVLSIMTQHTNPQFNYIHYFIILIEFVKYKKYLLIENALERIHSNSDDKSSILEDVLTKATNERKQYCLDKIKSTYLDLVTNYSHYENCISVTNDFMQTNNLTN